MKPNGFSVIPRSPWVDLVVRKQWEMGTTRSFQLGILVGIDLTPILGRCCGSRLLTFLNVNRIPSWAVVQWRHPDQLLRGIFWKRLTFHLFSLSLSRNLDHESKWSVLLPTSDSLHPAERLSSQFRQRRSFIQEKKIRCFSRGFNFLRKFNSLYSI